MHGWLEAGWWGFVAGAALFVGALIDGIPESIAIGVSLLGGTGVSVASAAAMLGYVVFGRASGETAFVLGKLAR